MKNTKIISERMLSKELNLNRKTVKKVIENDPTVSLGNFLKVKKSQGNSPVFVINTSDNLLSDNSIPMITECVAKGEDWMTHYFNFVDYFRSTKDIRLVLLPPSRKLDLKHKALIASIVCALCEELDLDIPGWAKESYWINTPWFISGIENLKAMAILESPLWFRRNNIWVLENFLSRA